MYGVSSRNALNPAAVARGRSAARYFSLRQNYCPLNLELARRSGKVNAVLGNCCGAPFRQKLQRLSEILVDAHIAYGCVAALMNKACVAWKHATYFGASYLGAFCASVCSARCGLHPSGGSSCQRAWCPDLHSTYKSIMEIFRGVSLSATLFEFDSTAFPYWSGDIKRGSLAATGLSWTKSKCIFREKI